MDPEYDIVGGYMPMFLEHLAETRARLGLQANPRADEGDRESLTGSELDEVTDSDSDDFSDWTRAERDTFFRALSVHSRWRPDLIAACVPTKHEEEVWRYLEALEEGATRLAARSDDLKDVDVCANNSGSNDVDEDMGDCGEEGEGALVCEPALEASQAWIDVEERMAAWIIHEERLALEQANNAKIYADKPPVKRTRGRPRGSKGTTQSHELNSDYPRRVRRRVRNPSSIAQQREGMMTRLEVPHLQVLDAILKENEEATQNGSRSRQGSEVLAESGDQEMFEANGEEALNLSNRTSTPQGARTTGNVVIDPVLLVLSGEADPAEYQVGSGTVAPPLPTGPSQSTLSGTSSQPPVVDELIFQPETEVDLALLSPGSRRRVQKRLHMRRKRAALGKNTADTRMGRLKPGKKAKPEHNERSIASTPEAYSEEPFGTETKPAERMPKKNKPGLGLSYKLKARFSELGVDAAFLRSQGMDLLNLGVLGRLMGMYGDESETVQSIDAQLVRHLQAGMVSFVTDVIHRAIVWREGEVRLKQRSRAWRPSDRINIGAIEHAVDVIGPRYCMHQEYLEAPDNLPTEPEPDDVTNWEMCTPLLRPPNTWAMSPLATLTQAFGQEVTGAEDDVVEDETDSEALEEVLEEEKERDAADMAMSATEEGALLNRLKVT